MRKISASTAKANRVLSQACALPYAPGSPNECYGDLDEAAVAADATASSEPVSGRELRPLQSSAFSRRIVTTTIDRTKP
jgi:hypothetical protein